MPSEVKAKLIEFLENGQVDLALSFLKNIEVQAGTRTGSQNSAMHLWYTQVADECNKNGVDAKLVMSKVIRMDMTPEFIKAMWKTLQRALFKTESTTQLKKTGQIDRVYDHFVRFFADEFELELPPFPHDEKKTLAGIRIEQVNNLSVTNYPDYKEPTI